MTTDKDQPESPRPEDIVAEDKVQEGAEKSISVVSALIEPKGPEEDRTPLRSSTPWTLQQFFNGEIDLDVELAKRFPTMPVMSSIHFRNLGTQSGRGVATLTSGDEGVRVIIDADAKSRVVQMSFTFGSMITLRFNLDDLSDMDRSRWLELMRREEGGLAFLWGPSRWQKDYLICVSRKYFTNLYAFSPRNFEAAIRMTPAILEQLLNWLEQFWKQTNDKKDEPPLLTW
jgi:hypothetical protein